MKLYQFLEVNLSAMKTKTSMALPWLASGKFDLNALENQLAVNDLGYVDLAMEEDKSLFGNIPPASFYTDWTADEKAAKSATVIVGSNLGYGLNKVLSETPPSHKVLLIEPRAEMLAACLAMTDYSQFIAQGRLLIAPPVQHIVYEHLGRLDLQYLFGRIHLRMDLPSRQLGSDYAELGKMVRKLMENMTVEFNTLRKMQDTMVGNEIDNFKSAFANGTVSGLKGSAAGLTAVILGAGPSLGEFGPQLAEQPGNALYATALQTLPAVKAAGIKPQLCMAIDYSAGIDSVFDRLDSQWAADIPLVYSTKVRRDVIDRYPGPTLPMWTLGGLGTFLMHDRENIFDAGGNVSVALLRFLAWCGVGRFCLVGQDFAWSGGQSHVTGHHAGHSGRVFDPARQVKLENRDGETVISAMPYVSAKRDMEADLARLGLPAFNVYGGGLDIAGTDVVTLDELRQRDLLDNPPGAVAAFASALDDARRPRPLLVFEPRAQRWSTSLRAVSKRLKKLFRKPARNHTELCNALNQSLMFIRQDPLYLPYLYNEVMDLAELATMRQSYKPSAMGEFSAIVSRVLTKVKTMDRAIARSADERAA